jgi:protein TonB
MASLTTSEFARIRTRADAPPFSMLEQKGLLARLAEEVSRAFAEVASDPRGFIRGLFSDNRKDARRRRLIYLGLGFATVAHIAFVAVIVVASWYNPVRQVASELRVETWVKPSTSNTPIDVPDPSKPDPARGNNGGGGSGGGNTSRPATRGVMPQMLPQPQIVKPSAPSLPNPALPMPTTIVGPASAPPPPGAVLGVPNGPIGDAPSPGMGPGDGIGNKQGSGVGSSGDGPGGGDGRRGGRDGGEGGEPGGRGASVFPWNFPQKPAGYVPFSWVYRPIPIVTPEAQANKVSGTVLLRATLNANGTITDIEIINPVPFMTESAIESLRRCRFRPATVNGVPITLTKVPIRINVHY